jgi:predicted flap endonuclease-1-like 5' DNA nuclease
MPMFLIQSAILITIFFVIGCIFGCLLRRWFGANEKAIPATTSSSAAATASVVATTPATPVFAASVPAVEPAPAPLMAAAVPAAAPEVKPEPEKATKPKATAKPKADAKPKSAAKPKAAPAAAPVKTTTAKVAAKPAPKPKADKKPVPAKLSAPIGGKPDNLTLINGIGNVLEKRLHGLGVFHFVQIANWTKSDAEDFSKSVGFPGRAEREGWMKEAALFAKGGTTDHARKVEAGVIPTSRKSTKAEKGEPAKPAKKK